MDYLRPSSARSVCPWKGLASYYDVAVDGAVNPAAGWCYARPIPWIRSIKGHVAFWRGVEVVVLD